MILGGRNTKLCICDATPVSGKKFKFYNSAEGTVTR